MTLTTKQKRWDADKAATRKDRRSRRHGHGSTLNGRAARRQAMNEHGVEKPQRSRMQRIYR
jgi:hypothetical protein